MKQEEKEQRNQYALILAGTSAGCSVVLGLIFGAVVGGNIVRMVWILFRLLFAFPLVTAALLLFTNMPDDYPLGFGAALYYTALVVAAAAESWWGISGSDATILGVVIAGLCCSVVWFGYFKPEIEARKRMDEKYRDED